MLYRRYYSQRSRLSTLPDVALRQLALQTRVELPEVKSKGQGLNSAAGAATKLPTSTSQVVSPLNNGESNGKANGK